jgi:hypothetical protein
MKFLFLALIFFLLNSIGCNNIAGENPNEEKYRNDTVIRDIPEFYHILWKTSKIHDKLRKLLKLNSLENGFDSLQIRILIDCGQLEPSSLLLFEKAGSEWRAVFYSFTMKVIYTEDGKGIDLEIQDLITENKSPKSGWINFSSQLVNTGMINLLDCFNFPDYNMPTDARSIFVEIGRRGRYRLFHYAELEMNLKIKEGPAKLDDALKLIEKEFNYKRPCQYSGEFE